MNKILSLSLLFSLLSCAYLVDTYEQDILKEKEITPKDPTENTTCQIIQKNILINDSQNSQEQFQNFINKIAQTHRLIFIDKVVLWSLVQINIRPDLSAPSAKLQLLLQLNGEEKYFNSFVTSNELAYPYFFLLENLLSKYKSRYKLLELANLYDKHMQVDYRVNSYMESFLSSHKGQLRNIPILAKTYIRGDETLKENERLPRVRLSKIVVHYLKTKKNNQYEVKEFLFSYNANTSFVPKCNFDMNLYDNSIFLINKDKVAGNVFGLKSGPNAFMAVSSQRINQLKPLLGTPLFQGESNTRSAALCLFKDRFKPNNNLWLVSSDSRDPGQHLFHLLKYGIEDVKKVTELDKMLKFSRHLFLKNPVRLIIESRRSDETQIQELLKLNIPIYNAKSLGKVWGYFKNDDHSSFLLDARKPGELSCNSL